MSCNSAARSSGALVAIGDLDAREDWDDEQSMPGSHAALVNAIILKAVSDLFSSASDETSRSEARTFLTARSGPWAANLEHLCWLVDLDPDVLRERILDILEGRCDLDQFHRRGIGNLSAEHGRRFMEREREREQTAHAEAKARAEQGRRLRQREKAALDEERRAFQEQLKAAEIEAGILPRDRRAVTSAEYLEVDGLPLGHVLRLDKTWETSTFCTFLNVLLPDKSSSMGRAITAACSEQGFILAHQGRYHLAALKQAAELMGVAILLQDENGNPVSHRSEAATASLRLRPHQPDT